MCGYVVVVLISDVGTQMPDPTKLFGHQMSAAAAAAALQAQLLRGMGLPGLPGAGAAQLSGHGHNPLLNPFSPLLYPYQLAMAASAAQAAAQGNKNSASAGESSSSSSSQRAPRSFKPGTFFFFGLPTRVFSSSFFLRELRIPKRRPRFRIGGP